MSEEGAGGPPAGQSADGPAIIQTAWIATVQIAVLEAEVFEVLGDLAADHPDGEFEIPDDPGAAAALVIQLTLNEARDMGRLASWSYARFGRQVLRATPEIVRQDEDGNIYW